MDAPTNVVVLNPLTGDKLIVNWDAVPDSEVVSYNVYMGHTE